MILLFTKTIPNKPYQINVDVGSPDDIANESNAMFFTPSNEQTFWTPTPVPAQNCNYPININDLFPYWLQKESKLTPANIIELTKQYYDWLNCGSSDINASGFFSNQRINDVETTQDEFVKYLASTYIPSIPSDSINYPGYDGGSVDQEKIRSLIDNVKVNLYTIKGSDSSYKSTIHELYDIDPDAVSVSYPKNFVLRLNGGRFDWMRDDTVNPSESQSTFEPNLTSSYLNISVISDTNMWQDYSYVVNVSGLSPANYETVVRPLLHPAGTSDFFQTKQDIFSNVEDSVVAKTYETPIVINYRGYTLGSFGSLATCYPGFTSAPTYTFPSWDEEISVKYYSVMTFGMINIKDFVLLSPLEGFTFPNETRSVTVCP
jgi:hypothetical protein